MAVFSVDMATGGIGPMRPGKARLKNRVGRIDFKKSHVGGLTARQRPFLLACTIPSKNLCQHERKRKPTPVSVETDVECPAEKGNRPRDPQGR
jgi:hypothetical protein